MKDDLRFGDRCRWYLSGSKTSFIDDCIFLKYVENSPDECLVIQYNGTIPKKTEVDKLERYPRFMEKIEVAYDDTIAWFEGFFAGIDPVTDKVLVWSDRLKILQYDYWRLIPQKDNDVMDIIKRIENNDGSILKELAEIILSAREKVNED
jgi:hypothetical protein